MAVVVMDGRTAVAWCSAVANLAAPTVTEINAGTRLETLITPTGLSIKPTTAAVPAGNLGTKYDWERAGRRSVAVRIAFHHDGISDTAWNLFPYGTNGVLVVRRGIDKTSAFVSGQGGGGPLGTLKLYPLECGEPEDPDSAQNTNWDFELGFFLTGDPQTRAVVA